MLLVALPFDAPERGSSLESQPGSSMAANVPLVAPPACLRQENHRSLILTIAYLVNQVVTQLPALLLLPRNPMSAPHTIRKIIR
jgi:hypothetical protein